MILVANTDKASIGLNVGADSTSELMKLGKAEAGFAWGSQKGGILKVERATNVTPFFQLSKLRKPWLGKPKFRARAAIGGASTAISPKAVAKDDTLRDSLVFDVLTDDEVDEA